MKQGLVLIIYLLFPLLVTSQHHQITVTFKNSAKSSIDSTINIKTQLNKQAVTKDSISKILFKRGFYNHLIRQIELKNNVVAFEYTLNKKYSHIKIIDSSNSNNSKNKIVSLSRKRTIIKIQEIENYLNQISKELIDQGYSFTEVNLDQFKLTSNDTIEAVIKTSIQNKRYIDKIKVKGYKKFPRQLLRNYYYNVYNNKTINDIEKGIDNIPFIKKIKESEVLFKKDSTQIYLYLEKISTNTADGLIGFNNNEDKIELNGYVNLKLQNNLNRAETFLLEYRNDNGDQTTFNTSINIPYLWNSFIGSNANLKIQRRDSTYQRTEFETGLFFKPNWRTNIGINYTTASSNAIIETSTSEDFKKNGVEIEGKFQLETEDKLMPENLYLNASIGFNKRKLKDKSENQLIFYATFLKLWHLTNRSKLLSQVTGYYLKSDDIQFNELYQFGGSGTVRGFNQNSIDSSFYTTLATEYRYRLNDQIYLHSILDIGVFENFNSKKIEKLYGYGGGIAILTQAGVLNISIANGSFNDAKVDLSSTVAHINLKINF